MCLAVLFWAVLGSQAVFAQVYQRVAPPSPYFQRPEIFSVPTQITKSSIAPGANPGLVADSKLPGLDPFSEPLMDGNEIRPWNTLAIPPGSWGAADMWPQEQLYATTIKRFRSAFVQNVDLNGGMIRRDGATNLGYSWAYAGATMVVPLGEISDKGSDNLLVFTPSYRVDWIDGPSNVDVPSQLHSASMVVGWRRVFTDRWTMIAGIQPGVYKDRQTSEDGFRLSGLVLANYQMIPDQLTLSVGVVYTGRNDVPIIPGAGVTWVPNPNTRFDLNFPKPKISRRISHLPFVLEDWIYIHGSFGGGEWAVQRTNGAEDTFTLSDFRVGVGYERILNGGTGYYIDAGYVFGRELEFESTGRPIELGDSFLIEAGLKF